MTQTQTKAMEVLDSVYKSIGGSGSNPDIAQFRTQLQNASPAQVATAHKQIWSEILQPLVRQGGQPLPESVQEEVALVAERMHTLFTEASTGARVS